MRPVVTAVAIALCFVCQASVVASPEECRDAIDQYKSARGDVASAIRGYASCVSSSDGHDDCSSEFSTLQSAHDDFESAVSDYENECN